MYHSPIELIRHMLDEAVFIYSQTKHSSMRKFIDDEKLKRAVVRSLEIIGEATKKLPEEFKGRYANIEWKSIAGMRDKLIHDYFGVDYEIVYDVAIHKVPAIIREFKAILAHEK